jgi:hypothetical protein
MWELISEQHWTLRLLATFCLVHGASAIARWPFRLVHSIRDLITATKKQ